MPAKYHLLSGFGFDCILHGSVELCIEKASKEEIASETLLLIDRRLLSMLEMLLQSALASLASCFIKAEEGFAAASNSNSVVEMLSTK